MHSFSSGNFSAMSLRFLHRGFLPGFLKLQCWIYSKFLLLSVYFYNFSILCCVNLKAFFHLLSSGGFLCLIFDLTVLASVSLLVRLFPWDFHFAYHIFQCHFYLYFSFLLSYPPVFIGSLFHCLFELIEHLKHFYCTPFYRGYIEY